MVLYLIENCYTNLVCAEYKKVFGFEFLADLSVEFDIGTSYSTSKLFTWNYTKKNIKEIMSKVIADMKEKGFVPTKQQMKQFSTNYKICSKWRIQEIKEAIAEKKAGKKTAYTGSHWKDCFEEYKEANRC